MGRLRAHLIPLWSRVDTNLSLAPVEEEADESSTLMSWYPWCSNQFGRVPSVPVGHGVKPVPAGSHGGRLGTYESAQTTAWAEPGGRYVKRKASTLQASASYRDKLGTSSLGSNDHLA